MQEMQVPSLGQEDPLEEGKATHSSFLSWGIRGHRSLAGRSPWGCKDSAQFSNYTATATTLVSTH